MRNKRNNGEVTSPQSTQVEAGGTGTPLSVCGATGQQPP